MADPDHPLKPRLMVHLPWLIVLALTTCARPLPDATPTTVPPSPTHTLTPTLVGIPARIGLTPSQLPPAPAPVRTATALASPTPPFATPAATLALIPRTPEPWWDACPDGLQSRLRIGDRAFVGFDPFISNRIRRQPNNAAGVLGLISPGEVVLILEGPECGEKAIWWLVQSARKDLKGWTAEGDEAGYWLYPAGDTEASRIPPPRGSDCLAADPGFCTFTRQLERWVIRGDIDSLLANARSTLCDDAPPQSEAPTPEEDEPCVYWGTAESGLDITPASSVVPAWKSYADPGRRLTVLLLPPFREQIVPGALPRTPAVAVQTGDPLWDWMLFLQESDETWEIVAFLMVPKTFIVDDELSDHSYPWP